MERIVFNHLGPLLRTDLDHLDDTVIYLLHRTLSHLENIVSTMRVMYFYSPEETVVLWSVQDTAQNILCTVVASAILNAVVCWGYESTERDRKFKCIYYGFPLVCLDFIPYQNFFSSVNFSINYKTRPEIYVFSGTCISVYLTYEYKSSLSGSFCGNLYPR